MENIFVKTLRILRSRWLVLRGKAIDIWLNSPYPANVLSNLYPNAFVIDGVKCCSMEGFLQSLKYADMNEQKAVCALSGKEAKNKSTEFWKQSQRVFWAGKAISRESPEFMNLVLRAYSSLFSQNESFRDALLSTKGKVLLHSKGNQDPADTILTEKEFCGFLTALRDPDAMVSLLENMTLQGNYNACFDLGQLFYSGENGISRDIDKSISFFTKAAEHGVPHAAYQLGKIYETDEYGELNYEESYGWYSKAALSGLPEALNNLGSCFFFGRGTNIDYEKAFSLYKESAEKENPEGEMNVAICYASGKGTRQDFHEAYLWWSKAANHGHVKAMVNLATCYEFGYGTEKNLIEAYNLYKEAADHGDSFAADKLEELK